MISGAENAAFGRCVRPVLKIVPRDKARAILRFRPDPQLQIRIEKLAGKSTEGRLSAKERALNMKGYVRANKFVAILQRQARQLIEHKRRR